MTSPAEIADCLSKTLSSDPNVRIAAELKFGELLAVPETGLALSQIVAAQDGSATPVELKMQIRQTVFNGLSDPARKIRTLCAHTLSSIANCDWPDEYPDLLKSLIALLSSASAPSPESINRVHGAMQVFTEFIKSDLTEDQILPVLRDLLPVLLGILGSTETHTPLTRSRTVSVFRQCVISLFMVKDQHPQAVKEAIASVLPVWLEAFKVLLNFDPKQDVSQPGAAAGSWDNIIVRIQIFKTLDTIHTSFPRTIVPYLSDFLDAGVNHLNSLYDTFERYFLSASSSTGGGTGPLEIPKTSEDEPIEFLQLITSILDFVSAVVRGGKGREWFGSSSERTSDKLTTLVDSVFRYIQMTDEDEEEWANNANAFVAQEDDDAASYSVRVAGLDLLTTLIDRSPTQTTSTCHTVIQQVVTSSSSAQSSGKRDWWKPLEAALTAVGSLGDSIQELLEDLELSADMNMGEEGQGRKPKPIDIESLLTDVVPRILGMNDYPFLQGRGFVFASQYAKLLPMQLAGQYLDAAVQVIEAPEANIPVKVSAVKAVHNFASNSPDSALTPFIPRIAKDLGPFLSVTSEDTLSLVLETLAVVVEVDKGRWLTPELASGLVVETLEVWVKNNRDPIFLSIFPDIINSLAAASTPGIYETVVQQAMPPLCNAISSSSSSGSLDQSYVAGSAIELVSAIIRASPPNGLGPNFFSMFAPNLFKCLGTVEDRDVIQNGITSLTLIIRKDCSQLLLWKDSTGQSGLDYVLRLVAKILQSEDESAGLTIGELIIHLLRRAGDAVVSVLPELLHAMVVRMQSAKTASFVQSLVIPFAFLINSQRDTVLSLLEEMNIQNPSGGANRTGLDVLIQTWCENAETFQGFWPSRTSTLALTQMFASERPSLQGLVVKGDLVIKPETKNVIMTRSRTKATPTEFTNISFPVKAVKILLHEVQSGGESATIGATQDVFKDVDSDDGDEDWTDAGASAGGKDEFEFLSELIGPKGMAFDNDDILEDSDDEDLKGDPISQMDMQAHLTTFFRECAQRNTNQFHGIVDQLSAEESFGG
ncbi:hypothetical protein D9758_009691 [Tetrapyrgos nigripes]|uniref:Importin-9 central HEAT repeats domain-containing protein n=1 Tax=Tetrapyrgos nigripes TaxID=182062 RepID=A0A8H5FQ87_9AGAR|nr:hypothetical protein D9758_009691 [Tetrapyrgos nigripes]